MFPTPNWPMSLQGSPTLTLEIGSRRTEKRVAAGCVLLAAAAAAFATATMTGKPAGNVSMLASIAIAVVAAVTALAGFRNAGWIGRSHGISRIVWQADGRWRLIDGAQQQVEAILRGDSRVGRGYAWLRWEVEPPRVGWGRLRTVLLAPGDVSEPDLRRLSIRLRIHRAMGPTGRAAQPGMAPHS
jgi:hypothetical protein